MKKICIIVVLCFITFFVKSQNVEMSNDSTTFSNLEIGMGLSSLISHEGFDLGPKLELSFKEGPVKIGIFGEYSKSKMTSIEVKVDEGLTKINILNKDLNIFQFGIFGEYPVLTSKVIEPFIFGSSGVILGNFSSERTSIAFSLGIGTKFIVSISDKILLPFVKIGCQKIVTTPIEGLNQNGLKLEIGINI